MNTVASWSRCWVAGSLASVLAAGLLTQPPTARARHHGQATDGLDCSACHTPSGWRMSPRLRDPSGFNHDRTGFPLRAGHRGVACVRCHDGSAAPSRQCSACHVDDHGGRLGEHCDNCHNVRSFQRTDALTLHSRTRLPLTGMHALVDCADCHRRQRGERYSPVPPQCFACHEQEYRRADIHPVHDGSGGAAPLSRDCSECHGTSAFSPAFISAGRFVDGRSSELQLAPSDHDRAFVLSYGPHRAATCAACHVDSARPRWTRCTGCHAHAKSALAAAHPNLGEPADGTCLACHPAGAAR